VKQIVGGSLRDHGPGPQENHISDRPPSYFAETFRRDALTGGHVIKLGPGNDEAARQALAAWPDGLQIGGGIRAENAAEWLEAGASHVIVTSWLFPDDRHLDATRLAELVAEVGTERIVIDLSCRRRGDGWVVTTNRWQTLTELEVTSRTLDQLAGSCAEFLIHAADVEGLCSGIDESLVERLGQWNGKPVTYAGGVSSMADLERIDELGCGRVDVTVGSGLDLFGGRAVAYERLVAWNQR
jgi:phosphoribosylformimino-5-aminoimidazole carboxamide ribotide isomerase